MQVAPTILKALGLDPNALQAVKIEGTQVLPDVSLDIDDPIIKHKQLTKRQAGGDLPSAFFCRFFVCDKADFGFSVYGSSCFHPGPRKARPDVTPVNLPSSNSNCPFTKTYLTPFESCDDAVYVATSWIVFGSNRVTSAK